MSDPPPPARVRPDPRLLVCGFGGFPGFPHNPAALVVNALAGQGWSPDRVETHYLVLPTTWSGALETAADALRGTGAAGVLVVGVASGAEGFRVEMRAQNRARADLADAAGAFYSHERISRLGPAVARATAPVEPMVEAIRAEGLPVQASSDAGDYLCNYLFYRLLTEVLAAPDAPPAAFLHIPPGLTPDDLERGVKAAAGALARTLAFGAPAEPVTA